MSDVSHLERYAGFGVELFPAGDTHQAEFRERIVSGEHRGVVAQLLATASTTWAALGGVELLPLLSWFGKAVLVAFYQLACDFWIHELEVHTWSMACPADFLKDD